MNSLTFLSYASTLFCFAMAGWIAWVERLRILSRLAALSLCASAIAMALFPSAMRHHGIEISDHLYLSICCIALSLKYLLASCLGQTDRPIARAVRRIETIIVCATLVLLAVYLQGFSSFVSSAFGHHIAICIAMSVLLFSFYDLYRRTKLLSGLAHTEILYIAFAYCLHALLFLGVLVTLDLPNPPQRSLSIIVIGVLIEVIVFYLFTKRRPPRFASAVIWVSLSATTVMALIVVYGLVVKLSHIAVSGFPAIGPWFTHLVAALVTSALLYPVRKNVVRLYRKLFPGEISLQDQSIVGKAIQILQSISTLPEASKRFGELLKLLLGVDFFDVLTDEEFSASRAKSGQSGVVIGEEDQKNIFAIVQQCKQPLVVYDLSRYHLEKNNSDVLRSIDMLGFEVAMPMYNRSKVRGCVLLGRRISNRYFSQRELEILEPLVDAFSAAIENAELYTRLRDARVYNSMLLESLDSGVIATNLQGKITLSNKEALRILAATKNNIVDHSIAVLPQIIASAAKLVLESKTSYLHQEGNIVVENDTIIPVRYSIAPFDNYIGESLGVIIVIDDLSHLKMLQRRAQRSDRLAGLGTLAAGMAHEIKNPLVSVKTFTELLPIRHEDPDFREQFSTLVLRELERIEEIVDRLLDFAQPSKVKLEPISLLTVLTESIQLVLPQCQKHAIELRQSLDCGEGIIAGDAKMLGQVFANLLLNAIDAIGENGTLTVSAQLCRYQKGVTGKSDDVAGVVVSVKDTGCGISQENLSRVFDPFFTTKSSGTGLGLPISYGIVQEHGATIDAQSDGETGTTFLVTFPLL